MNVGSSEPGRLFRHAAACLRAVLAVALFSAPLFSAFEALGDNDARSRSIGNATTAYAAGNTAFIRNPALLGQYGKTHIALTVLSRGLGLELGDKALVLQGGLNSVISFPRLLKGAGVGIIGSGYFANNNDLASWVEYQANVGFGIEFIETLSLGVSFLGQGWTLSLPAAADLPTGFAPPFAPSVSAGVLWDPLEFLSLGLSGINLVRPNAASLTGGEAYGSRDIILGVSLHTPTAGVSLDLDLKPDLLQFDIRLGGEGWIGKVLRLAAGIEIIGPAKDAVPSVGFGMRFGPLTVDYALFWSLSLGAGVGNHILTVAFTFPVK